MSTSNEETQDSHLPSSHAAKAPREEIPPSQSTEVTENYMRRFCHAQKAAREYREEKAVRLNALEDTLRKVGEDSSITASVTAAYEKKLDEARENHEADAREIAADYMRCSAEKTFDHLNARSNSVSQAIESNKRKVG